MADNQKYYYLKLKDNFFDTDEMIVFESMPAFPFKYSRPEIWAAFLLPGY